MFPHTEDRDHFDALLAPIGGVDAHAHLFNFSDPADKRRAFNRERDQIRADLIEAYGDVCQLVLVDDCGGTGDEVDHVIPLSTNRLAKELRGVGTSVDGDGRRKKAPTEPYGSNDRRNLVLACSACNGWKLQRILDSADLVRILRAQSDGR